MTAPPHDDASDAAAVLPTALRTALGAADDDVDWFRRLARAACPGSLGRLGPFELLSEAGRGGQGLVYRARQDRPAREVALKRPAAGIFATPAARARFEREIQSAAALSHPNIVAVHGAYDIDGQLVVALQWIDGVPLDLWARPLGRAARDIPAILAVFRKICDAVHHAHQRGVIHRDLKPSNVLVDDRNEPHVLDFGLALRPDDSAEGQRLTHTGVLLGTPAFAAPEQLRGDVHRVDVRSDVYGLGALLYACLTGRPPVDAARPPAELAQLIERVGVVPPQRLASGVNRELGAIVRKALHADPEQRYASVDALRADLERYTAGEPVRAHPPSTAYYLHKFAARHRAAVGIVLGYFLLTTTALVVSTALYARSERERIRADAQSEEARRALQLASREAATSGAVRDFLQTMLLSAGQSGAARGPALTVREMLDRAGEHLAQDGTRLDPAAEGSLRLTIANAYRELGLDAAAEPHYRVALERRTEVFGHESHQVADVLDALARVYRALGRLTEAEQTIEDAWAVFSRVLDAGDPYFARTAASIGLVKRSLHKFDEAEAWYLESLRRYETAWGTGPDNPYLPPVLNNLGALYVSTDRLADAEARLRDSLARCRVLYGEAPHFDALLALSALADVLARRGDPPPETEALFDEAHRGMVAVYGAHHWRVGALLQRYAGFLALTGRVAAACGLLRDAEEAFVVSERWSDALGNTVRLALTLRDDGRQDEAITSLRASLDRFEARVSEHDLNRAAVHLELGLLLAASDQAAAAEPHLRRAAAVYEQAGSPGQAGLTRARAALATLSVPD